MILYFAIAVALTVSIAGAFYIGYTEGKLAGMKIADEIMDRSDRV